MLSLFIVSHPLYSQIMSGSENVQYVLCSAMQVYLAVALYGSRYLYNKCKKTVVYLQLITAK